jgi:hypothetical protein
MQARGGSGETFLPVSIGSFALLYDDGVNAPNVAVGCIRAPEGRACTLPDAFEFEAGTPLPKRLQKRPAGGLTGGGATPAGGAAKKRAKPNAPVAAAVATAGVETSIS